MPRRTFLRLAPTGLAVALLAACASTSADRQASPAGSQPPSIPATPSATPATCGIDKPCASDSPPPSAAPTPAPTDVPSACDLVTENDLRSVTFPDVTLLFTGDPTEEPPHLEPATGRGVTSFCRYTPRSRFAGTNGDLNTIDSVVEVRVQSSGADLYFPVRGGDTPVTGIGDEAMLRLTTLYVHTGRYVLTIQVGISSPGDLAKIQSRDIGWAKQLATTALTRV